MRHYQETREASGEILRLAIPRMAQHPAGCTPASYALWYEYLSGCNPGLKAAMDRTLQDRVLLDSTAVNELCARLLGGPEPAAERVTAAMQRMLGDLVQHAALAGSRAGEYHQSLDKFGERLKQSGPTGALDEVIQVILEDTEQMRSTTRAMKEKMDESAQEVGALRAELARARGEAQTDPLTGICNRRGLDAAVARIAAPGGRGLDGSCLIVLDIDHFKRCNDTYGHLFGDNVIRSVAQTMAAHVKGQDTVARIGGEEFAILLPDTPLHGACTLAERLRATVQNGRIRRGDGTASIGGVTVSLGVASHCAGEGFEDFMRRADGALYRSKGEGRNRVTVAGPPPPIATIRAA